MTTQRLPRTWALALVLACCGLLGPARAIETAFSNDGSGASRTIKVCALMLRSSHWENSEPCALPTLSGTAGVAAAAKLVPSSWELVNPLAPAYVTQDLANLWDPAYNGPVSFDGLTSDVRNDFSGSGDANANDAAYNGQGGNIGGPNSYYAHAFPMVLREFGPGGSVMPLPAVGQPLPRNHPAYWEVPLTARTVTQLANFDVVLVNTQRNLAFTSEELELLRQFLDLGGTLFFENSHGLRIEVGGDKENDLPNPQEFLAPVQFVDGWPYPSGGNTRPDGYPMNSGGVSPVPAPAWTAPNPNHALLSAVQPIAGSEIGQLGDVMAADHLILNKGAAAYLAETVLQVNFSNNWTDYNGAKEPAVAVMRIGSGKLVLSGIDIMEDVHKAGREALKGTGTFDAMWEPDLKFMVNLLAWQTSFGGNRRGGPSNKGVTAGTTVRTLTPRYVWNAPQGGLGGTPYDGSIDLGSGSNPAVDFGSGLREPLCAANGLVYIQYEHNGEYRLAAIDIDPSADLDNNGSADDGLVDMALGAPFDTVWISQPLAGPVSGACVTSVVGINGAGDRKTTDVLLTTQAVNNAVRLSALTGGVDPAGGTPFVNWTTASGTFAGSAEGYVDLPAEGLAPNLVSAPVVYGDTIYVATSYTAAGSADTGGWTRLYAVRLTPDPATTGQSGQVRWVYPDLGRAGENVGAALATVTTGTFSRADYLLADTLKQVDLHVLPLLNTAPLQVGTMANHSGPAAMLALADSTRLTPVIGLVNDQRSGLTTPTVFVGGRNGDTWAVSAEDAALGWRLTAEVDLAQTHEVTLNGTVLAPAETIWRPVRDISGNIVATDVLVTGAGVDAYRAAPFFAPVVLHYRPVGSTHEVVARRQVYPRHRLLRSNRDSGLAIGQATLEHQTNANSAPMLLDNQTVVSTMGPLFATTSPTGAPGDALASGPVVFYRTGGDSLQTKSANPNNYDGVAWQFNPDMLFDPADNPRLFFGSYGAPVKYGSSVVVAGRIVNAQFEPQGGAVFALDANPSFSITVGGLTPGRAHYLLDRAPSSLTGDNSLVALPQPPAPPPTLADVRSAVIDPRQFTVNAVACTVSLRPDLAHQTLYAAPLPGPLPGTVVASSPQALYGRPLWLVTDVNNDGKLQAAEAQQIYVPLPVRWAYWPNTVFVDSDVPLSAGTAAPADGGGNLSAAPTLNLARPQLLRFQDPGRLVNVTYTTAGLQHTGKYAVGALLPALSFSPVVAGDRVYVSGTAAGTGANTALIANGPGVGGLLSFRYGADGQVVQYNNLRPDFVPGWSNATSTAVDASYVRGTPVPTDGAVLVSYTMAQGGNTLSPLYAVGGTQMLVTESMRLARIDLDGAILWQVTGARLQDGAEQASQQVQYNPPLTSLITSAFNRPSRGYNLPGGNALVVDTGNDRVIETAPSGMGLWPLDMRANGGSVLYHGLRNFGLNRPTDAARTRAVLPVGPETRDLTVIADRGNRRLLLVSSHQRQAGNATQTYYDALPGQPTDDAGGHGIPLTAPQIYNPTTKEWIEQPYAEVQLWNPTDTPAEPLKAGEPANTGADPLDTYVVARVDGSDQLYNIDLFPNHDGVLDADGDGVADGVKLNLDSVKDRWANDFVFRGLKAFHRFRVGQRLFLGLVMAGPQGGSRVVVYEFSPALITDANAGLPGTHLMWPAGLSGPWTFDKADYENLVYDPSDANPQAYYSSARANVPQAQRQAWWGGGSKGWNPTSVARLSSDNLLAIVNGAANSVNQTASNSEVLLVRFDPANLGNKRVETMLPDLSTTSTYPASAPATQRRPTTGSYPVSSPVYAGQ